MEMIAAGVERARRESIALRDAADRLVEKAKSARKRLPGLGHRVHSHDPRTDVLFRMAREGGVAKDGVAFMESLEVAAREKIKPFFTILAFRHRLASCCSSLDGSPD